MGTPEDEIKQFIRDEIKAALSELLKSEYLSNLLMVSISKLMVSKKTKSRNLEKGMLQLELLNLVTVSEAAKIMGYGTNEGFLTEWKKLGYPIYRYGNGHPRVSKSDLAELQRKSKIEGLFN